MTVADIESQIEALRTENARLKAQQPSQGYYQIHGALTFKGKSEIKRATRPPLPCGCRMYLDVLTAGRWRALGRMIAKGESACLHAGRLGQTPIFCRCQLAAIDLEALGIVSMTDLEDISEIPF